MLLLVWAWLATPGAAQSVFAEAPYVLARPAPPIAALGGPVLLYDRIQGTATGGVLSQNNTTNTAANTLVADDFRVPFGATWTIERMVARGFYSGTLNASTCESGDVSFWTNDGGFPGTLIASRVQAPTSDQAGLLTFDFAGVELAGGQLYWVSVVCSGSGLNQGTAANNTRRWNWYYNTTQRDNSGVIINPGGGFNLPNRNGFNRLSAIGGGPDLDFRLFGQQAGTPAFPVLALSPANPTGTALPGESTTATLTISNTGDAPLEFRFPAFAASLRLRDYAARGLDVNARLTREPAASGLKGDDAGVPNGNAARFRVGGPDTYGYTFIDSGEPDGPAASGFVDIRATGTPVTLEAYTGCTAGPPLDEGRAAIPLPFEFPFYGQLKSQALVYANGVIGFNPAFAACTFTNATTIPNPAGINDFIAPFWDDLVLNDQSAIHYESLDDGRFVIQYTNVPRFGSAETGRGNTFQVILDAGGGILINYGPITAATQNSFTVGIENAAGNDGLLVIANQAGYVVEGLAIQFNYPARFLAGASPASGVVAPGASVDVEFTLNAFQPPNDGGGALAPGTYTRALTLVTTDPDRLSVSVPVTLVVPAPPQPDIVVSPTPLAATLDADATGQAALTIRNNTDTTVTYRLPQYDAGTLRLAQLAAEGRLNPPSERGRYQPDLAKGAESTLRGAARLVGAGGPDGFGYRWIDSDEPGGPAYVWNDIRAAGTAVALGDDAATTPIPMPFAFPFYGEDKTEVRIVSNGFLNFGPASTAFTNAAIPTAALPNDFIAPFWDDLHPGVAGYGSEIHYLAAPDRFVVQFTNVPRFADRLTAGLGNTFQVVLRPSGQVEFYYEDMRAPLLNSATVGMENAAGTDGLQVVFNAPYVRNGLAVRIFNRPAFVTDVAPASGTIPAGGEVTLTAEFSAAGLLAGTYEDEIVIETSLEGEFASFTHPVRLTVLGDPAVTVNPEALAFGDVIVGFEASRTLTVTNSGVNTLTVSDVTFDNPDYSADVSSFVLQPGESRSIAVTFAPAAPGASNGMMAIVSNAPSSPTMVALTGAGLPPPAFAATPGTLSFEVFRGNVSAPQTVTLANTGAGAGSFQALGVYTGGPTLAPVPPSEPDVHARGPVSKQVDGAITAQGAAVLGGPVVQDGSFEAGIPNPFWEEGSVQFGTPLCSVATCGAGSVARTGDIVVWFGGTPAGDQGFVAQSVAIPAGLATLRFWVRIPSAASGSQAGFMRARINDDVLFTVTNTQAAQYANYTEVALDITPYAGQTVLLTFESEILSGGTNTNIFLDDVSIDVEPGILVNVTPQSGSVAAGAQQALQVTVDATAAEPGNYTAELRIATDDPANPEIVVPIAINVTGRVSNEGDAVPVAFRVHQNQPNPFAATGATQIRYDLPEASAVSIRVYDTAGRLVATLLEAEQPAGFHDVRWDARGLSAGVYFLRVQAGAQQETMRMTVVR
ncbi:MAG: choice-of-anchor D domain-containing protein [Rubricoccaceae bacterium]